MHRLLLAVVLLGSGVAFGFGEGRSQVGTRPNGGAPASADPLPSVEQMAEWAGSEEGLERARSGVLAHIAVLPSGEGTMWVRLLSVLERVDTSAAPQAIRAVGTRVPPGGPSGAELIMEGLSGIDPAQRAPLLAFAAHLAGLADPERAAEIRAALLDQYPDAPEADEVRLLHASWLLEDVERREDGMRLLEELIVGEPQHPLAPEARRLYEANGGRASDPGRGGA